MNDNYIDEIQQPLQNLYNGFIDFLPRFIVAVIVLVLGWIIASAIASVIKAALQKAKVDEFGDRMGLADVSARTGTKMSIAGALAWLVKWFLLISLFLAAADILGLDQISDFLKQILDYIPNVIAAAAILLAGLMLARFVARVVRTSVTAAGLGSADLLATVTQWAIGIFTILAALEQLGIADDLARTLYSAIIYMIAIAGALAFGLGGRDHASRVLDRIERDIKS